MGDLSKRLGDLGEAMAANYLTDLGYKIVERNFRSSQGEVDIIAEDKETLAFVEIKNYSFRSFGSPYSAIGRRKKESIIHAAGTYLFRKHISNKTCRFDVLTLYWDGGGGKKVELIKDAFRLG